MFRTGLTALALVCCAPSAMPPRAAPEQVLDSVVELRSGRLGLASGSLRYTSADPAEFSDHAVRLTGVHLPERGSVELRTSVDLSFPPGTILSKTFFYPRVAAGGDCESGDVELSPDSASWSGSEIDLESHCLIETRLLVRTPQGWSPHEFVWRGTRAIHAPAGRLVALRGHRPSGAVESFDYLAPSQAQCASCHQGARGRPEFGPIGTSLHRLTAESAAQLLGSGRARDDPDARSSADAKLAEMDPARRYLDANCGYCHNPNGLAASSGLFLDHAETDPARLGLCKLPAAMGARVPGATVDLYPSSAERSLIYRRMASSHPGVAMPELGRSLVDEVGLKLVGRWIEGMPGGCE